MSWCSTYTGRPEQVWHNDTYSETPMYSMRSPQPTSDLHLQASYDHSFLVPSSHFQRPSVPVICE